MLQSGIYVLPARRIRSDEAGGDARSKRAGMTMVLIYSSDGF